MTSPSFVSCGLFSSALFSSLLPDPAAPVSARAPSSPSFVAPETLFFRFGLVRLLRLPPRVPEASSVSQVRSRHNERSQKKT